MKTISKFQDVKISQYVPVADNKDGFGTSMYDLIPSSGTLSSGTKIAVLSGEGSQIGIFSPTRIMTQTEYDACEKADGIIYFITEG